MDEPTPLPIIRLRAKDDPDHVIAGVLLGEGDDPEWPSFWVVIPNEPGWDEVAAAVATPVLLNKRFWEEVHGGNQ